MTGHAGTLLALVVHNTMNKGNDNNYVWKSGYIPLICFELHRCVTTDFGLCFKFNEFGCLFLCKKHDNLCHSMYFSTVFIGFHVLDVSVSFFL